MHAAKTFRLVLALLVAGLIMPAAAAAQFTAGQTTVGAHVGLSGVGSSPALGVSGELAYNDRIGIGAWADTWSYGWNSGFAGYSWNIRYIAVAGTGSYHFPIESQPKLDPFAGLALGYFIVSTSTTVDGAPTYSGDASRIFLGGFGGVRYLFNDNLAGVARLGFGASYFTVGVDLKL
jgi:hypothetical protein